MSSVQGQRRLALRPTEIVDRDRFVHFTFDGKRYAGLAGDTISSALWANGVHVVSRSFKYHRPRGDFTFDGSDANALLQVDDEPNVRAGTTPIEDGMEIRPQNVVPSLDFDVLALNGLLHRFLPVGFYYKAFHSKRLWPFYEEILRHIAGLGEIDPHAPEPHYDQQYKHTDVVVAGGGPAGLSAALAAAEAGARVLLVEQERFLGGRLGYLPGDVNGQPYLDLAKQLIEQVGKYDNFEILLGAVAMGYFDDHWVPAFSDDRLYKIRARSVVVATGALNRSLIFTNNDLPGILTGRAAARLLNLYAIPPGENVLVVSANDDGLRLALALREAGLAVTVAEERDKHQAELAGELESAGIRTHWRHTISTAHGRRHVASASLLPLNADGSLPASPEDALRLDCDTIVLAVGYNPNSGLLHQSGAKLAWDEARREILPAEFPPGIHAAGRVCGSHDVETALLEGRIAGMCAADNASFGSGPSDEQIRRHQELRSRAKTYTTRHFSIPGSGVFRFVDFAEDVTEKDVYDALAEGFDSIELLKRYTTISMGPDQGRYSLINPILLTAEAHGASVDDIGRPTSRPPLRPIKMGTLRGRPMEPVRRTPLHGWHAAYGCRWLNAGPWKRPDVYHKHTPAEEVLNVRRNVGIIDVSTLGKIRLHGRDVPELLSRLYVNRWDDLSIGKVGYGVMCNEAGTLFDDGVTGRLARNEYYMTTTTANSGAVPERILWWLEQPDWDLDVHLVNVTTEHAAINVAGPNSRHLLARITEGVDLSNEAFPYMSVRQCRLAGVEALLLRIGFTGERSYEVHFPAGYAEHVWTQLLEHGEDLGVMPFSLEAQGILRLEKGHFIGQDLDPVASPLEMGLEWAVELDKADFLGKVGIIRKQRKGPSKALVGFEMADPSIVPPEGNLVVEEKHSGKLSLAGWITSARFSPTLEKSIGLAWVPHAKSASDSEIVIRIDGQLHQARVAELPFYDPQGERLRR